MQSIHADVYYLATIVAQARLLTRLVPMAITARTIGLRLATICYVLETKYAMLYLLLCHACVRNACGTFVFCVAVCMNDDQALIVGGFPK